MAVWFVMCLHSELLRLAAPTVHQMSYNNPQLYILLRNNEIPSLLRKLGRSMCELWGASGTLWEALF
jgi:hypothetical protein